MRHCGSSFEYANTQLITVVRVGLQRNAEKTRCVYTEPVQKCQPQLKNEVQLSRNTSISLRCHRCATILREQDRKCHRCGTYLGDVPLSVSLIEASLQALPVLIFAGVLLFLVYWTLVAFSVIAGAASLGLGMIWLSV